MKRILSYIGVFAVAFAVGYLFVPLFPASLTDDRKEIIAVSAPLPLQASGEQVLKTENADEFIEFFTDDSRIGRKKKNKIEIRCFLRKNDSMAEIRFYSRMNDGTWEQRQVFEFEKDNLTDCEPEIKDFNNDGLNDFTYVSNVAARGANKIRTLFIYDKKTDKLIHIKNSEDFPNLMYNKKLDCLDAWLFHGSTTTVFLRIEGDMLKEFASVDTGLERVVTVIDKDGTRRVLSKKKMNPDDVYSRYSSFDPPRP